MSAQSNFSGHWKPNSKIHLPNQNASRRLAIPANGTSRYAPYFIPSPKFEHSHCHAATFNDQPCPTEAVARTARFSLVSEADSDFPVNTYDSDASSESNTSDETSFYSALNTSTSRPILEGSKKRHRHNSGFLSPLSENAINCLVKREGLSDFELRKRNKSCKRARSLVLPSIPKSQFLVNFSEEMVPEFSGNFEDYHSFRDSFLSYASVIPESTRLRVLKDKLKGTALDCISGCVGRGKHSFLQAFKLLDKHFDKPDLVAHIFISKIGSLAETEYSNDHAKFSTTISEIRKCFNRIVQIDPYKVMSLNGFLAKFSAGLPSKVQDKVYDLAHYDSQHYTFGKVLVLCEDYVERIETQEICSQIAGGNSCKTKSSSLSSDDHRCMLPVSCNTGLSKPDINLTSQRHSVNRATQTEKTGESADHSEACKSSHKSQDSLVSKSSGHAPLLTSCEPAAGDRDRLGSGVTYTCHLCHSNDHASSYCTSENLDLNKLLEERKLCRVCLTPDHESICPLLQNSSTPDFICSSTGCVSQPHNKRICPIMLKPL